MPELIAILIGPKSATAPSAAGPHSHGTSDIDDNAITNAKLRDGSATSVIGRSADSIGDPADIAASADGQYLRRTASALGFGTIPATDLPAAVVLDTDDNVYTAGKRQSVQHDPTNAGLRLAPAVGDPASAVDGDLWYNSTTAKFRKREAGANADIGTGGAGGAPIEASYVTVNAEAGLSGESVLGTAIIISGLIASRPTFGVNGRLFFATDEGILYRDNAAAWLKIAARDHAALDAIGTDNHHAKLHKADHVSGGADAFASTDVIEALSKRVRETGTPTDLAFGAITDGQFLQRSGTSIIGAAGSGGAPVGAPYVTTAADAGLTAEKVLGTDVIMSGLIAARPAASIAGLLFYATDEGVLYRDTASTWVKIAVHDYPDLDNRSHGDTDHSVTYEKQSNKGIASGYAGLGTDAFVPTAQLGSGTPDSTKFLRGDKVYAVPPGGSASYYGVRAESYITSGDGSAANPYNASAIQSAYDALPSTGGIVFIKEGIWRGTAGTRILVGNAVDSKKKAIFKGAGTWPFQIYGDSADNMLVGTHVQAGFTCYVPSDFYDMAISPPNLDKSEDGVLFIHDMNVTGQDTAGERANKWTQGFTVKRVKFKFCNIGIKMAGVNMGTNFWQFWGIEIEQCGFVESNMGIRINRSDIDSTAPSQGWRGRILNCEFRSVTGGRAFDFDISNSKAEFGFFLLEGTGSATGDYAFRVKTNGDGGVWIHNIDFGDGSVSPKDALLNIGREARIENFRHRLDVDLTGRLYCRGLAKGTGSDTGKINLIGITELSIEGTPGQGTIIGTIDAASLANSATIVIRQIFSQGHIGSSTAGASPHTYTNVDMKEECVYLVGGTISGVTRGGQSLGTERVHYMRPGDSIVITHTAAPTIRRFDTGMF